MTYTLLVRPNFLGWDELPRICFFSGERERLTRATLYIAGRKVGGDMRPSRGLDDWVVLPAPVYATRWSLFLWYIRLTIPGQVMGTAAWVLGCLGLLALIHLVHPSRSMALVGALEYGLGVLMLLPLLLLGLLYWQLPSLIVIPGGVYVELRWPRRCGPIFEAYCAAYERYRIEGEPAPEEPSEPSDAADDDGAAYLSDDAPANWDQAGPRE
ncbi:MAG: hypothetical protein ACREJ2_01695 [Planctomycetota bacterium]